MFGNKTLLKMLLGITGSGEQSEDAKETKKIIDAAAVSMDNADMVNDFFSGVKSTVPGINRHAQTIPEKETEIIRGIHNAIDNESVKEDLFIVAKTVLSEEIDRHFNNRDTPDEFK